MTVAMSSLLFFLLPISLISSATPPAAPVDLTQFTDAADPATNWPGCPGIGAANCAQQPWCNALSTGSNPTILTVTSFFDINGAPTTINGKTSPAKKRSLSPREEMNEIINKARRRAELEKRITAEQLCVQPTACGALYGILAGGNDTTNGITLAKAGTVYDLLVDYPSNGATGGTIAIFSAMNTQQFQYYQPLGSFKTGNGGEIGTFTTPAAPDYQYLVFVFVGDVGATNPLINYYIMPQGELPGDPGYSAPAALSSPAAVGTPLVAPNPTSTSPPTA